MKKSNIDGLIFDLDGTVYLGDYALPGAVESINELRRRGKETLFVSNKPLEDRYAYANKLTRLGIPTSPEQVITSALVLGDYLARHAPELAIYVVGEDSLLCELRGFGLHLVDEFVDQDPTQVIEPLGIDAVVVAFDRTLNYRKLNTAYQALIRGARFFATNADKACPMPAGAIPDAGFTIAGLEHSTGRKVEMVAGKPSPLILETALEKLGLPARRCMMIGDRVETDVLMGQRAGMRTALVLTGVTQRSQVENSRRSPDYILKTLAELPDLIV